MPIHIHVVFIITDKVTGCSVWKTVSERIAHYETVKFEGILFDEGGDYNPLTGNYCTTVVVEFKSCLNTVFNTSVEAAVAVRVQSSTYISSSELTFRAK